MIEILQFIAVLTFLFIWILFGVYLVIGWFGSTPFYPSSKKHFRVLEDYLKNLDKDKYKEFVDIGSGDGRVAIWAGKLGYMSTGVEINPFLTLITRLKVKIKKLSGKVHTVNKSFYKIDYSKFDIVYLYIFKEHMEELLPKLEKELKPHAVIISNVFKFENLEPVEKLGRFNIYKLKK